jgi:hypothetical protein
MERWAQIILSGVDQPVSEPMVAVAGGLGYDVELERQKLSFKMRQWEAEVAEKQAQREVEVARLEAEVAERKMQMGS